MQHEQIVSILESLGAAIDPRAGTETALDAFRSPDVIRALFAAAALLKGEGGPAAAARSNRPASAGAKWTDDEDSRAAREYDEGLPIAAIAREHHRTTGAITSRLVKLGKIDPAAVRTRERGARMAS
jgi:hypothetical protein